LRARRIPLADLDRIRMTVARDHSIDLVIRYRRGTTIAEQEYAFEVRDLDLDHEALDLAFRIAQICRLGGYLVRSESQDARVIDLVAQAPATHRLS
jgi:hypothetical protein